MDKRTGLIVKATGGFYYVQADGVLHECRARGLFRKEGVSPLVGDRVELEPTGEASGYVTAILPRKNALVRPPLANVDTFVIVASVSDPAPNALVIDKLMAIACHKEIRPMLVITKSDLGGPDALEEIYRTVGIPVFAVSRQSDEGLEEIRAALSHGISAFSGNTGVGKSSLLNRIDGGCRSRRGRRAASSAAAGTPPATSSSTPSGRTAGSPTRRAFRRSTSNGTRLSARRSSPAASRNSLNFQGTAGLPAAPTRWKRGAPCSRRCGRGRSTRRATRATAHSMKTRRS